MNKILVATDFTECADFAVSTAASIAKKTGAHLMLLHVISRPINSNDDSYKIHDKIRGGNTLTSDIKKKLNEVAARHHIEGAQIIYEFKLDVLKTILRHADHHQVDLIVMGAFGNSQLEGSFLGSNTENVILQAKMPVLIVQEPFKDFKIKNMVFASEFNGEISKNFPQMKKVMDLFDAQLHLLKVNTPNRFQRTPDSLKLMEAFSDKFGLKKNTRNIYNDLSIEDGITNFTKSIDVDLIAITPDGLWNLAHIFSKNRSATMMKKSIKGILSLKTRQPALTPIEIFYDEGYKRYKEKTNSNLSFSD